MRARIGSHMSPGVSWKVSTVLWPRKTEDLLAVEMLCLEFDHARDDEQSRGHVGIAAVGVDLGAGGRVEKILDGQGCNSYFLANDSMAMRSVSPSMLIQRTADHAGRCTARNASKSSTPRISTWSGE